MSRFGELECNPTRYPSSSSRLRNFAAASASFVRANIGFVSGRNREIIKNYHLAMDYSISLRVATLD